MFNNILIGHVSTTRTIQAMSRNVKMPFNLDKIDEQKILNKVTFAHPYYDKLALENQAKLKKLQNVNNTLFCGSYFGYGFHEDGITSSIDMLKSIND